MQPFQWYFFLEITYSIQNDKYLKSWIQNSNPQINLKDMDVNSLFAMVDSDFCNDEDTSRSHTGYVIFLGGAVIDWSSKKQVSVTLSTSEAEYVAACSCASEIMGLRNQISII